MVVFYVVVLFVGMWMMFYEWIVLFVDDVSCVRLLCMVGVL